MTRPTECRDLVKGWLERYPREWTLVLSCGKPLRECLNRFYRRELSDDEAKEYAKCWLYWYFHDVVGVPEHILDEIDWNRIAQNIDLGLGDIHELIKQQYLKAKEYIKRYEEWSERKEEEKALSLEEVERLRWPTPEEAEKFCNMFPHICEKYPIVPQYIAEGQVRAWQAKELVEKHPEWLQEVDGVTLDELWRRMNEEALEEVKKEYEEAKKLPEGPVRAEKMRSIAKKIETLEKFITRAKVEKKKAERKKEQPSKVVEEALPEPVEAYLNILNLNVVKWEPKKLPEFGKRTAYFITVMDEATKTPITIVYPYPYTSKGYRVINITNKKGKLVSVLVPIGEVKKKQVAPIRIPQKKIEKVRKRVEKEVPEKEAPEFKEASKTVDWKFVRDILRKMQDVGRKLTKMTEKRVLIGIQEYLDTMRELAKMMIEAIGQHAPQIMYVHERVAPTWVLSEEEYKDLWELYCAQLAKRGLSCEKYRKQFEEYINPSLSYRENEDIVYDLVQKIATEEALKKEYEVLEEPKPRRVLGVKAPEIKGFRYKYVNWGVTHLALELNELENAMKKKDIPEILLHCETIIRDAEKLLKLLKKRKK